MERLDYVYLYQLNTPKKINDFINDLVKEANKKIKPPNDRTAIDKDRNKIFNECIEHWNNFVKDIQPSTKSLVELFIADLERIKFYLSHAYL